MHKLIIIFGLGLVLGACGGSGGGGGGDNNGVPGMNDDRGAFVSQVSAVIDDTNDTDTPRQLNGANFDSSDTDDRSQPVTINN